MHSQVARKIAAMLWTGKYDPPTVFDPPQEGRDFASSLSRDPFCPPEYREVLRRWITDAARLQEKQHLEYQGTTQRHGEDK